ncbi:hypothetical protein [Prevotella sp. kh1p2]|uniref:hypothetical protein n=1 Tax=Prevotella sp. kh1p2 TaxID=1761883 RepID=UPI000B89D492|nr:hypothetical protein [Prevotella sp. kh1p2]
MKKKYMTPMAETIRVAQQGAILDGSWNDHADAKQNNGFLYDDEVADEDELNIQHRNLWED